MFLLKETINYKGGMAAAGSAHARNCRGGRQIEAVDATHYCQGISQKSYLVLLVNSSNL